MKHIPRIFLNRKLNEHEVVELSKESSHHLIQVLRLKPQDPVIIFNSEGGEYGGELILADKKRAQITLHEFNKVSRESPLKIELVQGIARNERMDIIVQKAVELGATSFTPVWSDFSNVKIDAQFAAKRIEHWQKIIIGATEQSGRCQLMQLNAPLKLSAWFAQKNEFDLKLICHPGENNTAIAARNPQSICVLIGPEGGLSDAEVAAARAQHFESLSLGPRILRAETAAIAALSLVQKNYGDM